RRSSSRWGPSVFQSSSLIGSTATVRTVSPPEMVTPATAPASGTALRKWTRRPVWASLVTSTKSMPLSVAEACTRSRRFFEAMSAHLDLGGLPGLRLDQPVLDPDDDLGVVAAVAGGHV